MKIVVTGCCGFIGSHLSEFLLKNTENTILGVDIMNDYYDIKQKEENLDILSEYDNFDFYKEDICSSCFRNLISVIKHQRIRKTFCLSLLFGKCANHI